MVVGTDPGGSSNHRHDGDYDGDDTPSEHHLGRVLGDMVLESADDGVDEPGDTRGGAAGVDTTEMLKETSEEDTDR